MRRFYAPPDNFSQENVILDESETKHLRDVLRMHPGEDILVFNGIGDEFLCRISQIETRSTSLQIIQKSTGSRDSKLNLRLAIALLKGQKFDLVVQKASEIGVAEIIPLITMRADVKIRNAKDSSSKLERWSRIALESAKQTGRAKILQIIEPINFNKFIESGAGECFLFSERNGGSFSEIVRGENMTAIIGPEGGWDDTELTSAEGENIKVITLGGRILRAETAGIVIPALLQNRFGDLS